MAKDQVVIIDNGQIAVEYDLSAGQFRALDRVARLTVIANAWTRVNEYSSNEPGLCRKYRLSSVKDELGKGKTLHITCGADASRPSVLLDITLYEGKSFIVLTGGIDNTTGAPITVHDIYPMVSPKVYAGHSTGMVEAMEDAVKSGFLKYSKVAVRLVPDTYADDCEQGWWDDEHWRGYGHLVPPYETSEKWGEAVTDLGGIPDIYVQTGFLSLDYARAYPDHMLFNGAISPYTDTQQRWPILWGILKHRNTECSYDYTDAGFQLHVSDVWANLKNAGIKGVMFDYPETGWRQKGGFDDKYATTASAYRTIFELAKKGLGQDSYVHERNIMHQPFLDLTVGVVDNQRVCDDTDLATPEMYARCGLRWYKNRVIYTYDTDGKNLFKVSPNNRDGLRQMFTMIYMVSGRLLLANSFSKITPEQLHDMSRIYPIHSEPRSPRPLDAFTNKGFPQVYDFAVNSRWHQLAFYNTDNAKEGSVGVDMSKATAFGSMELDRKKSYYIYDFWNDQFLGKFAGSGRIEQTLRPGEVRMMSVHAVEDHPQFISTNRHVMQGYVDMKQIKWNDSVNALSGRSEVVGGEAYEVVIATNGRTPVSCSAKGARCEINAADNANGLAVLRIQRDGNGTVDWSVAFSES